MLRYLLPLPLLVAILPLWGQESITTWDSLTTYLRTDSVLELVEDNPTPKLGELLHQWEKKAQNRPLPIRQRMAYSLGEFYQLRARPDSGIYWYQNAISLGEEAWGTPHPIISDALNGLAICYYQKGDFENCLNHARQVLDMRIAVLPGGHSDIAQAHNNYGIMSYRGGRADSGIYHMAMATQIWENDSATLLADLLTAYNNLGIITGNQGDYHQGLNWYQKILTHSDGLPPNGASHTLNLAGVYNNIAVAYRLLGDRGQAIRYLRQSIDLELEFPSPDPRNLAIKYDNMGTLLLASRQPDSAMRYFELADKHAQNNLAADDRLRLDTRMQVARAHLELEHYDQAQATLEALRPEFEQKYTDGHSRVATLYMLLGNVLMAQGDSLSAERWIGKALDIRHEILPEGHNLIKLAYFDLARCWWYSSPEKVDSILQLALKTPPGNLTPVDIEASRLWGQWLARQQDLQASHEAYGLALRQLDTLRRSYQLHESPTRLLEEARALHIATLDNLFDLHTETGDPALLTEAWSISEDSRAIRLRENLQMLEAKSFAHIPESLQQAEGALRAELTRLDRQIARAERSGQASLSQLRQLKFEALARQDSLFLLMEKQAPDYYQLRYSQTHSNPEEVQQWLQEHDRDLVEYVIHEDQGFALVIRPEGLIAIRLPQLPDLTALVNQLRNALFLEGNPRENPDMFTGPAFQLYELLWAPILARVPDLREKVIVVPDGSLGYLPMGLLLTESSTSDYWFDLPYLLVEHEISYAPSAQWLVDRPDRTDESLMPMLALAPGFEGDPGLYRNEPMSELAFNREEANEVARLLGGRAWLNEDANESALKEEGKKYRIIHFASHAAVDDRFPLYSFIQLSPTEGQDGRLEIAELFGVQLSADLVVLSACETGMGQYIAGEGILSLAQGFSYSGVHSALTTWWPVNDEASAQLMKQFYAGIRQGKSRTQALREAQLTQLKTRDPFLSHPFFWAGYQLTGEPGPIELSSGNWSWGWILGIFALVTLAVLAAIRYRKKSA